MKKSTFLRSLILCGLSMCLCISMLAGSTFAWFTDEVKSGNNIIMAGNLDVELTHTNKTVTDETVAGATNLFSDIDAKKWEPNAMAMETFTVKNLGNLALKYELSLNVSDVTTGKDGTSFATALMVAVVNGTVAGRAAAEAIAESEWKTLESISKVGDLMPTENGVTDEDVWTVIIWWKPSDNDNNFNMNNGATDEMSATIGVNLFATQLQAEQDSFGPDYDVNAPMKPAESWDGTADSDITDAKDETKKTLTISTAEELAAFAAEVNAGNGYAGWTIELAGNIDLVNKPWTPIGNGSNGFNGTFDGKGYIIYNLNVTADTSAGLFGYLLNGGNIKNLTVENATIKANDYAGAILGRGYTDVVDCHVINATVTVTPYYDEAKGIYDGGAKAGGVVGQLLEGSGNTVVGCTAKDVTIIGYRDLGGVLGMAHNNNSVSGCSAENVTIKYLSVDGVYDDGKTPNQNAGAIVGRINASATVSDDILAANDNYILAVDNTAGLINAIKNAPVGKVTVIGLADGEYAGDIEITVAALGKSGGDVVIKAIGDNAVISGTVTLGYRDQGVGATMYDANVTFEGITFDHANAATHSLDVQDVKSLTLKNCTIISDGEYGLTSARGNGTGTSTIVGCTFENAAMQLLGNFATGLVIDDCTFNDSKINVQAGNGVTVQNCEFNATLTTTNIDDSFYIIRSNSTPITVKNCEINIDSALAEVVTTAQAKWYLLANRGATNWTVSDVAVTLTAEAAAQTQLKITACTSSGVINTTNLTVNGVVQ